MAVQRDESDVPQPAPTKEALSLAPREKAFEEHEPSGGGEKPVDVGHLTAPRLAWRRQAGRRRASKRLAATSARALPAKIAPMTTKLLGARSASPVRPCPTVQPVAIDAPAPRPMPPTKRFTWVAGVGALRATVAVPARREPAAGQHSEDEQQVPRGELSPATAETRPVVPGTTARPKFRPASVDAGQAAARGHADPDPGPPPVPRASSARCEPREDSEQQQARSQRDDEAGSPGGGVGDRALQSGPERRQRTGVDRCRAQRHAEDRQERPDVSRTQLVPDARGATASPTHGDSEEEPADHGREQGKGQLRGTGEAGREDQREQKELHRNREAQRLDLRPLAFECRAEAGVQAEGAPLRAVPEGDSHHQRAEQADEAHGASPSAIGNPRARHSETPSSRTAAR